ncbi:MAG: S-adenosylmethionine:tRNA ribosyltransferase-isomerase [Nocardioides sp.]
MAAYPVEASPTGAGNRFWRARSRGPLTAELARAGRPIAYGYLDERFPLSAYQTVFATRPGSAEMPSAGRPFTTELVTLLVSRGIAIAPVTLHTGLSSQEVGEGPPPEWFEVPETTARLLNAARVAGGRIVAVGTTVTRALASAVDPSGLVVGRRDWTDPQASHLLLVEAVAGADLTRAAYDAAERGGYLWHEFGDSCVFLR